MAELKQIVDKLLDKAAEAHDSADALRFSQAALNAAHTKASLADPMWPPGYTTGGAGGGGPAPK